MKISGIYQIQSRINPGRIYIGSTVDINRRWNTHLRDLKNNNHHSEETKKKMSEIHKGKIPWNKGLRIKQAS